MDRIYLFHSPNTSRFCGGVFTEKDIAETWINKNELSGVLTVYPINRAVYDWAIEKDFFRPVIEKHFSSEFKAGFSSASQEH